MKRLVSGVDKGLSAIVSTVVVLLLLFMVVLAFTQVVLRNVTGGGIVWAETVLQHTVLATGMFGAVLAARQGRQIAIDALSRIVGKTFRAVLSWIGGVFTIAITVILTRASWIFVQSEREFGTELADNLPTWPFQLALPVGFALIGLQMIINLVLGRTTTPEYQAAKSTGAGGIPREDVEVTLASEEDGGPTEEMPEKDDLSATDGDEREDER